MSRHVLVTTIGAAPSKEKVSYFSTKYQFDSEQPREGKFFSALLCDFLKEKGKPVEQAVVLLTAGAKDHPNWQGNAEEQGLKGLLEERGISITEVDIPDGQDEAELWAIFDKIGEHVPQEATVTLDITHGFRSLPQVMLLACAYFEVSGEFDLANVYYGAFIDKDKVAQVVDLTPMLTLFEWANAVDAFKRSGNLRQMADLLQARQAALYKAGAVTGKARLPLAPLAKNMRLLMDAIELGRLRDIDEPVAEIRRLADEVRPSAERWEKPFVSQIDKVLKQMEDFQLQDEQDINERLAAEFRLIEWYHKNEFYIHAGLLLREWVISYVMSRAPEYRGKSTKEIFEDDDLREEVSRQLNSASKASDEISDISKLVAELAQKLNALPEAFRTVIGIPTLEVRLGATAALSNAWSELRDLRNDLAHLGHRKQVLGAEKIKQKVDKLINSLKPLVPSKPTPQTE